MRAACLHYLVHHVSLFQASESFTHSVRAMRETRIKASWKTLRPRLVAIGEVLGSEDEEGRDQRD